MNFLITFFAFFYSVFLGQEPDIPALRQLFYEAQANKSKTEQLFKQVGNYSGNQGILIGYKAAAFALKAKHGSNPLSKLKNVKKAQQYFSEAVQHDSKNLEIRFMRYAVEVQTPKSLGYSKHVPEDKELLLEGLKRYPKSDFTPETARIARDFMQQYCECTEQEKQSLEQVKL